MTELGTCCWGHVEGCHRAPCLQQATKRFESGMEYCTRHAQMVEDNRNWLLERSLYVAQPANHRADE